MALHRMVVGLVALFLVALLVPGSASAQGRGGRAPAQSGHEQGRGQEKGKYKVDKSRAVSVTREVLVKQGYEVVRIEEHRDYDVVYYRAGNRGRGRGKGPVESMIIRRVRNEIVFERAPSGILVDIDVRLRL